MGLYIGQDEKRSELQSKIIADLQEKSRTNALTEGDAADYKDSRALENQHETRAAGVIIGLLIVILIVVVIFIVARSR